MLEVILDLDEESRAPQIRRAFDAHWPTITDKVRDILDVAPTDDEPPAPPSESDQIGEILALVRDLERRIERPRRGPSPSSWPPVNKTGRMRALEWMEAFSSSFRTGLDLDPDDLEIDFGPRPREVRVTLGRTLATDSSTIARAARDAMEQTGLEFAEVRQPGSTPIGVSTRASRTRGSDAR
jgi:hypothetical protein